MSSNGRRTLLIDADDTLWQNDLHYRASTARFAELVAGLGVARRRVQPLVDHYEHVHIAEGGYGPTSFTSALFDAWRHLTREQGREPTGLELVRVRACTQRLFSPAVELLPDVAATLERLAPCCSLIMVTKGEVDFQLAKLQGSGLAAHFERAHVLAHKDVSAYLALITALRLDPNDTWMVGNSPRSDINPALRAGLGAVYIPSPHTWHQELEALIESPRLHRLERFAQLAALFA